MPGIKEDDNWEKWKKIKKIKKEENYRFVFN